MNEERISQLFAAAEPAEEPPLPPGYLEDTRAGGRRALRRRRVRHVTVGGVAALAAVAATGVTAVAYQGAQPGTPNTVAAAAGPTGSFDPLHERLRPGWLPSGWTARYVRNRGSMQALTFHRMTSLKQESGRGWELRVALYRPGAQPRAGDPLDRIKFGTGTSVDPVRGMPAERFPLSDQKGYALVWRYPSGAHAGVLLARSDNTKRVIRHVADKLHVDGDAAIRFPYTVDVPADRAVTTVRTMAMHLPGEAGRTSARLCFDIPSHPKSASCVGAGTAEENGSGPNGPYNNGHRYGEQDRKGFWIESSTPDAHAEKLARTMHITGDPHDETTWHSDPRR